MFKDQQFVSKAEFRKYPKVLAVKAVAGGLVRVFNTAYKAILGIRALTRLKNSAAMKKRSTLGYALDVLMK